MDTSSTNKMLPSEVQNTIGESPQTAGASDQNPRYQYRITYMTHTNMGTSLLPKYFVLYIIS